MAYWKRQYTERPAGKPLFRPEPKSGARPDRPGPGEPAADPSAELEPPGEAPTRPEPPSE